MHWRLTTDCVLGFIMKKNLKSTFIPMILGFSVVQKEGVIVYLKEYWVQ